MKNTIQNNGREERRYDLARCLNVALKMAAHPIRATSFIRRAYMDSIIENEMNDFSNGMRVSAQNTGYEVPLRDPSVGFYLARTLAWRNILRRSASKIAEDRAYFGLNPCSVKEPEHSLIEAADNGKFSMNSPVGFYYDASGAKGNWTYLSPINFKDRVNYEPLTHNGP
jgi:hypothetical protein